MSDKDFRGFPGPAFWIATSMAPAMYAGQMTLRMMQAMQRMGTPARMMMSGSFGPTGWMPDLKAEPDAGTAGKQAAPKKAATKEPVKKAGSAVEDAEVIARSRDVVPTPTEVMADVAQVTEPLMRAARETLESMNETLKGMTPEAPTGRAEIAEPAPLAETMEPETMEREASYRAPGEPKAADKAEQPKAADKAEEPKAAESAKAAEAKKAETPKVSESKAENGKAQADKAQADEARSKAQDDKAQAAKPEAAKSAEPSASAETGTRASEAKSSDAAPVADRPTALDAPNGAADDLKKIKGVGPKLEGALNELGYFHFDQIAAWGPDELRSVDENLGGFAGRATRDDWIAQAKLLASGDKADASKRPGQGGLH